MNWSPLIISIKTSILSTILTFLLGILAAHTVATNKSKMNRILDILFTLPMVLPPTVAGFVLLVLFGKYGFLGKLLSNLGVQIVFTWVATVIAAVVVSFPLMYRSAKASFEQIDQNIIHAARTLGLSELKIFWRITMPLALPGVVSGGILSFARALGEFGATLMIAGNIPKVTQTMPLAIYMAMQGGNWREAIIWVLILVGISFLVIFWMNYFADQEKQHRSEVD